MDKEFIKQRRRRVRNILLILLFMLLIGIPIFGYFRISSGGRFVLREAKNVKMAFEVLTIEYYGAGKSIYSPTSASGMSDGVEKRLKETTENEGDVRILSYNRAERAVTSFVYETEHYRVIYRMTQDGADTYTVDFMWRIQEYGGVSE